MSNTWFRFKQFTINQDRCAMKITTDACIQGAWTPVLPEVYHVLDIGAGTGLLSLMLAQRYPDILIKAIEYDKDAASQAKENVAQSDWKERINVIEGDARTFTYPNKYDLIISNPPFFINSLLGPADRKNKSRHTLSLDYLDILQIFDKNLNPGGYLSILLPAIEYSTWHGLASSKGLEEVGKLVVKNNGNSLVNRVVGIWSKNNNHNFPTQELEIRDAQNEYSPLFKLLLGDYYLGL